MKKTFLSIAVMGALAGLAGPTSGFPFIPGAIAAAAPAPAEPWPTFRLCTGNSKKNYYAAGQHLKTAAVPYKINIEVLETSGSIDNLGRLLRGECDGVFTQADATLVFTSENAELISAAERAGVLYTEEVLLACNRKSGISGIEDLKADTVIAVGEPGTGTRVTFEAFKLANKKMKGSPSPLSGNRAIGAVADGTEVQCMMDVAGRNSPFIKDALSKNGDQIVIVSSYDKSMGQGVKDARGRPIYNTSELPAGTYPALQPKSMFGNSQPVDITTVDALFMGSTKYMQTSAKTYDGVLDAFRDAGPSIRRLILPKK